MDFVGSYSPSIAFSNNFCYLLMEFKLLGRKARCAAGSAQHTGSNTFMLCKLLALKGHSVLLLTFPWAPKALWFMPLLIQLCSNKLFIYMIPCLGSSWVIWESLFLFLLDMMGRFNTSTPLKHFDVVLLCLLQLCLIAGCHLTFLGQTHLVKFINFQICISNRPFLKFPQSYVQLPLRQ